MKKLLKKLVFAILFLGTVVNLQAQGNMEYRLYGGLTSAGTYNEGQSLLLSLNPTLKLTDNFKLETRAGFTAINITSTFNNGYTGKMNLGVLQAGPRYVFRSPNRRIRPALSILGGYSYIISKEGDAVEFDKSGISLSFNFDVEFRRFIIGFVSESLGASLPEYTGMRIGFRL